VKRKCSEAFGININKVKIIVYTIAVHWQQWSIIVTARLDSAQPNAGTSYELDPSRGVIGALP
jgi:ribose transport system permease protein